MKRESQYKVSEYMTVFDFSKNFKPSFGKVVKAEAQDKLFVAFLQLNESITTLDGTVRDYEIIVYSLKKAVKSLDAEPWENFEEKESEYYTKDDVAEFLVRIADGESLFDLIDFVDPED